MSKKFVRFGRNHVMSNFDVLFFKGRPRDILATVRFLDLYLLGLFNLFFIVLYAFKISFLEISCIYKIYSIICKKVICFYLCIISENN